MIKQRRESITQFEAGGRADLVAKENSRDRACCSAYLPAQLERRRARCPDRARRSPRPAPPPSRTWARSWRREGQGPGPRRHGRGQRAHQAETELISPLQGVRACQACLSWFAHPHGQHLARIPQHFIDELIARADIVEIIGGRVQLKKAGREYKACCPFHDEKTPSFWVSPDKQFYHCFGCGAHGTALGFLMEHDHLAFPGGGRGTGHAPGARGAARGRRRGRRRSAPTSRCTS